MTISKWKSILLPLAILVLAALISLLLFKQRKPPVLEETLTTTQLVEVMAVHPARVRFSVQSQGNVLPLRQTTLSAQVAGTVRSIADVFVVGGKVNAGDILLTLDAEDYETEVKLAAADLARAEAELSEEIARGKVAEQEWSRVKSTLPPALGLRKPQREKEEANVVAAQAKLERAKRNLARTEIRAPFNALVTTKEVDIGQFVTVGSALTTLFATDQAQVRLPLTDSELAYLHQDMSKNTVRLHLTSPDSRFEWQANLVRTEGVVDSRKRVLYAVAEIEDPYAMAETQNDAVLAFGQFVTATIAGRSSEDTYVIPRNAVNNKQEVLVMTEENTVDIRKVTVIRRTPTSAYVTAGLRPGERIILSPLQNPYQGMPVRTLASAETTLATYEVSSDE